MVLTEHNPHADEVFRYNLEFVHFANDYFPVLFVRSPTLFRNKHGSQSYMLQTTKIRPNHLASVKKPMVPQFWL